MNTDQDATRLPDPAGAVTIDPWCDGYDDGPVRTFSGTSWKVPLIDDDPWIVLTAAAITVEISGTQRSNGTVHRWVVTTFPASGCESRFDLPATTARMLSESLAAAVAEIERLDER